MTMTTTTTMTVHGALGHAEDELVPGGAVGGAKGFSIKMNSLSQLYCKVLHDLCLLIASSTEQET